MKRVTDTTLEVNNTYTEQHYGNTGMSIKSGNNEAASRIGSTYHVLLKSFVLTLVAG